MKTVGGSAGKSKWGNAQGHNKVAQIQKNCHSEIDEVNSETKTSPVYGPEHLFSMLLFWNAAFLLIFLLEREVQQL